MPEIVLIQMGLLLENGKGRNLHNVIIVSLQMPLPTSEAFVILIINVK